MGTKYRDRHSRLSLRVDATQHPRSLRCPDKAMEEMYYYRWWSLRKLIERTPVVMA